MAISNLQKQEWLVAQGKPKSYSYFMTGPNLGPDWDWNKALAGSYAPHEVQGFLDSGEGAYKAHKTKAKNKKAVDPGGPVAPGTNCAATAAKNITSWVAAAADNAMAWYNKIGAPVYQGGVPTDLAAGSFRKVLSAHLKEAVAEVGDAADEVIALKAMLHVMDDVDRAAAAVEAANQAEKLWDTNPAAALQWLENVGDHAKKVDVGFDAAPAGKLFGDLFEEASDELITVKANADEIVRQAHQRAVGSAWQHVAKTQADEWDDLGFMLAVDLMEPQQVTLQMQSQFLTMQQINGHELLSADIIEEGMDAFVRLSAMWKKTIQDIDPMDARTAFKLGGTTTEFLKDSVDNYINAYSDLVDNYANPGWWKEGIGGSIEESPIELLVTKYGKDAEARLAGEGESIVKALGQLGENGAYANPEIAVTVQNAVKPMTFNAVDTFQETLEEVKSLLPGAVPTKAEVLASLEQGYVHQITTAGTDDLNAVVQQMLEEDFGQPKTLTYFMTKEQKVDMILLPKETFDETLYVIKYKGQQLEGKGLNVAQQKYAAKNAKQAPLPPAAAKEVVTESAIPPIAPETLTPLEVVQQYQIPTGAKGWYADPVSDAQLNFLKNKTNHSFQEAWKASGAADELFAKGQLTKGQASELISVAKNNPEFQWTADDIIEGLTYGQLKATKVAGSVEDLIDFDDIVAGAKAADQGAAIAGTAQATSTAAPKNIAWNEPHTFTYVGDGKSKWGGAHSKWHFTDETGADWMLKNGDDFRLEGELAAHKIGHIAGFDIAEARIGTQKVAGRNKKGFLQKMYRSDEVKGELADVMPSGSFVGVDDDIIRQVQEHQVLDWLIGNHDGHKQNFLVLKDGRVVGIDKGQAFKFMGKDRLAHDFVPPQNFGEVAYNRMWAEYRAGRIDLDLDSIADVLTRIEALDDEAYAALVRTYAEGRFNAGSRAGFLNGTAARSSDDLVELAVERKRDIREQFEEFYLDQAEARGISWTPSWQGEVKVGTPVAPARVVKPGEILTPIDDEFVAGLQRAGTAGKTVYVAGTDVEDAQILFDIVKDANGNQVLRVNATLRPDADKKVMKLLKEEGGDKVTSTSVTAPLPSTPAEVIEASSYHTNTLNAAKTVNHHISTGDFEFNQTTISTMKAQLDSFTGLKKTLKGVDPEKVTPAQIDKIVKEVLEKAADEASADALLVTLIDDAVAKSTQLKGIQTFEGLMEEIAEQGAKGTSAAKVSQVPNVDLVAHFERLKDRALHGGRTKLAGKAIAQHIEEAAPEKVFTSVRVGRNKSYQIKLGGKGDRVNQLVNPDPLDIQSKANAIFATTDDGIEVIYRGIDGHYATQGGWLEMAMPSQSGTVTADDVKRAYALISDKMGVEARLAVAQDVELTYWRVITGTYRSSKEAVSQSSRYYKALAAVDENLRALGPNPTQAAEIAAYKDAYRAQFGAIIDDVDYLPIHSHALADHAEEIGWGGWERPEVGDVWNELDGKIVVHRTTAGDGQIEASFLEGGTGDGMMSQEVRQQLGFQTSAMSAGSDLDTGGAAGFFTRVTGFQGASSNTVVMNPNRVYRKAGNYNASHDTFGRLSVRTRENTLTAKGWAGRARSGGNETMMRRTVSYMDDIEITFFPNASQAQEAQKYVRSLGITHIRGVPIEERFVYAARPGTYTEQFFRKYVGKEGLTRRLRLTAADILSDTAAKVTTKAKAVGGKLTSRLKTKGAFGNQQLTKKLSAGRQASVGVNTPNGQYAQISMRYHPTENAITLAQEQLEQYGVFDAAGTTEALMKQLGVNNWTSTTGIKFKARRSQFEGAGTTIDLADFGVDLKEVSQYARPQVLREFVQGVMNNTMDEFVAKWGTIAGV